MATRVPREEFLNSIQNELEGMKDPNSAGRVKLAAFLSTEKVSQGKGGKVGPSCYKTLNFDDISDEESDEDEVKMLSATDYFHDRNTCRICSAPRVEEEPFFTKEITSVESLDVLFGEIDILE